MSPAPRSPLMGFNHNVQHQGWLFHVQTEDSGPRHPRITTHLFHRGVILATRRNDYTSGWSSDDVRELMQTQHKGVLRELRQGLHDLRIHEFLGDPPRKRAPESVAASWPPSLSSSDANQWEWRTELHDNPTLVTAWSHSVLNSRQPALPRTMAMVSAVRVPSSPGARILHQSFGERDQLLRALFPNGRLGGLVIQTPAPLVVGDRVMLQVEVGTDVAMEFQLECAVAWRGLEKRAWGLEFSSEEAASVRRMVLVLRGERAARRRKGPLMVSGTGEAAVWSSDTPVPVSVDVTERGIFIPDALALEEGDMVPVLLSPAGTVPSLPVHMLVEWRSTLDGGGAGLRFVSSHPDEESAVSSWVDSILRN